MTDSAGSSIFYASVEGEPTRAAALSQLVWEINERVEDAQGEVEKALSKWADVWVSSSYTGVSHSVEQNAEGTYDGTITATVTMRHHSND